MAHVLPSPRLDAQFDRPRVPRPDRLESRRMGRTGERTAG